MSIIFGVLTVGTAQKFLVRDNETEIAFRKPAVFLIFGSFILVTFISGAGFEASIQPHPLQGYGTLLTFLFYSPIGVIIAWFLGPDKLVLDLKNKQYIRTQYWLRIKRAGPVSDFSDIKVPTVSNLSTQYYCKLGWSSGKTMVIGIYDQIEQADSLAQHLSTTLNLPIVHEKQ